jgi:hypothetical protein
MVVLSSSFATTASYAQYALTVSGGVDNSISSSYAETASIAYSASSVAWNDVYGSPDFVETSQTSSMTVASSSWAEFAVTSSQMSISGSEIIAYISNDNSGSFIIEGNNGQLFSVVDNMSGSIFSVNDISGIPSIEVFDTGEIRLAEFGGNVGIGIDNPQNTLVVSGGIHAVGSVTASVFLGNLTGTSSWAENLVGFNGFSSSVSTRVSDLENFSSSLDDIFATDIELSNVSASLALDKVSNSQTSSMFVSSSIFASTASYIDGLVNGTASYAISASDSIYGFFAESTSMSLYSIDAESASYAITASYVMGGTGTAETASYLGDSTYYVDPNGPNDSANLLGDVTVSGSVNISGSLFALSKSFRIKHPSKLGMTLQHGVLEGPEHAVYIRGKVDGDDSTIEIPDFWKGLIDPETITVQLTPYGHTLTPAVKEIDWDNKIIHLFYHSTPCFYFIQATRIDIPQLIVEEK